MPRQVRHRSCRTRVGSGSGVSSSAWFSPSRSREAVIAALQRVTVELPERRLRQTRGGRFGLVERADAIVIGAGHNGLVAANLLADAGWSVEVLEATAHPGGAVRSGHITAPGYLSDLFSAF